LILEVLKEIICDGSKMGYLDNSTCPLAIPRNNDITTKLIAKVLKELINNKT